MSRRKNKNLDVYTIMKELFEHIGKHPESIPLIEKMGNVKIHIQNKDIKSPCEGEKICYYIVVDN